MTNNELRIELLERQVEALYSVLSEWDKDKTCFVQWMVADAINSVLNCIKYGEGK